MMHLAAVFVLPQSLAGRNVSERAQVMQRLLKE